ncbi:hypothetical protein Hdeb2414_s0016g00488761 [Helianthus debilis subsp. tardiflorus]
MARSTVDAGGCRGFVAGGGRGQGGGMGQGVLTEENMAATREHGSNKIRHAFEEHGQVEVALVKNNRTW